MNCNCKHHYLFGRYPMCLHKLFKLGLVKAITRQVTAAGVEFYIYREKITKNYWGWKLDGARTRLNSRDQIILAINLSEKYKNNVMRIRL